MPGKRYRSLHMIKHSFIQAHYIETMSEEMPSKRYRSLHMIKHIFVQAHYIETMSEEMPSKRYRSLHMIKHTTSKRCRKKCLVNAIGHYI